MNMLERTIMMAAVLIVSIPTTIWAGNLQFYDASVGVGVTATYPGPVSGLVLDLDYDASTAEPGGCIADLGTSCTCTESGCSGCGDDEFCIPLPEGGGEGTCHVNEGPCVTQADCAAPAVCTTNGGIYGWGELRIETTGDLVMDAFTCQATFCLCNFTPGNTWLLASGGDDMSGEWGVEHLGLLTISGSGGTVELVEGNYLDAGFNARVISPFTLAEATQCGDGTINDSEECDDGNTADGDGCSSVCGIEEGWVCTGEPSICTPITTTTTTAPVSTTTTTIVGEGLDHYKCYKIKETKKRCEGDLDAKCSEDQDCAAGPCLGFLKREVTLVDQFEQPPGVTVEVKKPKFLCPPVDKLDAGELRIKPDVHMKAYQIKRTNGQHTPQTVLVQDQFGLHVFQTTKQSLLLVPTAKDLDGPVPPLTVPRDDFQCYKIKEVKKVCTGDLATKCKTDDDCTTTGGGVCHLGLPKDVTENLRDQFEEVPVKVKKPKLLCLPTEKTHPIINDIDHLTCYKIKRTDGQKHTRVENIHLNNEQFGPEVVSTTKEQYLCVRSLKNPAQ
jgi:cysteine-rich repeat protein